MSSVSFQDFKARLDSIEQIVHSDRQLLNENLGATEKSGFRWIVKVILSFLCPRFCYDPFANVRMNVVARKLDEFLQANLKAHANHGELRDEIRRISDRIVTPLKERRTHGRFNAILKPLLRGLNRADLDASVHIEQRRREQEAECLLNTIRDLQLSLDSLTRQLGTLKAALKAEHTQRQRMAGTLQTKLDALPGQSALDALAQVVAEKQAEQNERLDTLEAGLRTEQEQRQEVIQQTEDAFDNFLLNNFALVLGEVLRIRQVVKEMSRDAADPKDSFVRSSFFAGDLSSTSNSSVNLASMVWYDQTASKMDQLENALNRCMGNQGQPTLGNAHPPEPSNQPFQENLSEQSGEACRSAILDLLHGSSPASSPTPSTGPFQSITFKPEMELPRPAPWCRKILPSPIPSKVLPKELEDSGTE